LASERTPPESRRRRGRLRHLSNPQLSTCSRRRAMFPGQWGRCGHGWRRDDG
jgi:hypothetical protein